jgi:type I restriction enzyme M protein
MKNSIEQFSCDISSQFKQLNKLIKNEPNANYYRHAIFSLITIKYISDVFDLISEKSSSSQVNYLPDEHWPEDLTNFHQKKALWIPKPSHWSSLYYRIYKSQTHRSFCLSEPRIHEASIAQIIDDALLAIEDSNFLKQRIFYPISCYPLDDDKLLQLVHIFADLNFVLPIEISQKSNLECIGGFRYVYEKYSQMFPEKHTPILQIDQVLELIR